MPTVWPNGSKTIPRVTSEFNPKRKNPVTGIVTPHNGIDLVGFKVVCSPVDGTIIYAGYNGTAGNEVRIREDGTGDIIRLLHNKSFLRRSGKVKAGVGVAIMGTTGQSTGPHCHYETKPNNKAINPRTWYARRAQVTGSPASASSGQRTAGPNGVRRRESPSSKAKETGALLKPGTVGSFTGWKHGESVGGNDVWYQGTSGDWFWSGGFKEAPSGKGLKDLNPTSVAANQRVAGKNGARRRASPSSKAKETGTLLAPGTVGTFKGWKHGEKVSGNDVWFQGTSGDWFWSGGFTSTATKGLTDLNPPKAPAKAANQRTVGSNGARRRATPSSKAPEPGALLAPGTVGNFTGWTEGEQVDGNSLWYVGTSGDYFWSGGFKEAPSKTGLKAQPYVAPAKPNLPTNPPKPAPVKGSRSVKGGSVNGRLGPYLTQTIVASAESGSTVIMDAWTTGEEVSGNAIWFRKKGTATWFWSGGFTAPGVSDLVQVKYEGQTGPKELTKFFPKASKRYAVEMGGVRDDSGKLTAKRPAGGDAIRRVWIHHAAATSDQVNYFLGRNERRSCPTVYVRTTGEVIEFVPYSQRPWSTGAADADAISVETQNSSGSPTWGITQASMEAIAQWLAWVSQQKTIDGIKVDFYPSADTVKGHNVAPGASTACPGPSMNIAWIIKRAQAIIAAAGEDSEPKPTTPKPTTPTPDSAAKRLTEIVAAWREYEAALAKVDVSFQKLAKLIDG